MPRKTVVMLACLMLAFGVVGCGRDATPPPPKPQAASGVPINADFSGAGEVPGALSSASTLPTVDRRLLSATSLAARIEYTSTSGITDGHTTVSGVVFVPKGKVPEGGWPIIAFGHSASGAAPECAPSLSANLLGSAMSIAAMVAAGFVVTMPDYQGLGNDSTYHPFLDSTTVGYNVIDSVRAARKLVPDASTKWVGVGVSQGGQAVWAANELMANYGGDLQLLGTVSLSAPTQLTGFADGAAAGTLTPAQWPPYALILQALGNEYGNFPLDDYRRGLAKSQWDVLVACDAARASERAEVITQLTADDFRPASPQATDLLTGYLQKMSLPQGPTAAPMLVVYGGQDMLVPPSWTDAALLSACRMGDVIDIQLQPDKGHSDIDITQAFRWVLDRFKGVPAANSCPEFIAASEPPPPADESAPADEYPQDDQSATVPAEGGG